jgi:hypothetical protein
MYDILHTHTHTHTRTHTHTHTHTHNRHRLCVSRDNQQKPHPDKDGFFHHVRLGLVGWTSYWCFGDSALTVFILVTLIKTFGLTEVVSDSLTSRKQKETETNAKILDLFKDALTYGLDTFGSASSGRFVVA